LVAPVSGPVTAMMGWVSPATPARPEVVTALENERDRWKQLYQNLQQENADLRKKFEQYGKGFLPSELPVSQILRRVIGSSPEPGEQITVRVWKEDGVERNTVATTEGVQLVGRVISATGLTCSVRLITGMSAGSIECVIMLSDEQQGPRCRSLSPIAGGRLQGRVRAESSQNPPRSGTWRGSTTRPGPGALRCSWWAGCRSASRWNRRGGIW
jgi:hypothetical protein